MRHPISDISDNLDNGDKLKPALFKIDVLRDFGSDLSKRRQNALIYSCRVGAMRTDRDNASKTVIPTKKTCAKRNTTRLRANLKPSCWYELASLSVSAARSRSEDYKSPQAVRHGLASD